MSGFTLHLMGSTQYERIEGVSSFVAEDESGSFGILPRRERLMTCLTFGLARYRYPDAASSEVVEYLAVPGGVLYFESNDLFVCTRKYLRSPDYETIADALDRQLREEEENIQGIKRSLHRLDEEVLKRMLELKPMGSL